MAKNILILQARDQTRVNISVLSTSEWTIQTGHYTIVTFPHLILLWILVHFQFPLTYPLKAMIEFRQRSPLSVRDRTCWPVLRLSQNILKFKLWVRQNSGLATVVCPPSAVLQIGTTGTRETAAILWHLVCWHLVRNLSHKPVLLWAWNSYFCP